MGIKLADTLEPMADFPSAYAKDIAFNDGDTLQEKLDTGSLGGGGVGYTQLSQTEYDALTEDEKLDGREYRTYDTGHIYKLGVEYGKDADISRSEVLKTYVSLYNLNTKKGLSLAWENNVDNTQKIIDALEGREEFIDSFSSSTNRIGIVGNYGTTINNFHIIKRSADLAIITATTNDGTILNRTYTNGTLSDWCVNIAVYTSLSELGLTADATFQDVIDKLPKGGSALLGVKEFTNYQTIFPYDEGNDQFARVHIVKGVADGSCMYARWFRKDGAKEAIASFNINDNKFYGWRPIFTNYYTSLEQLGLTAPTTIGEAFNAMPDKSQLMLNVNNSANADATVTDAPHNQGVLIINKHNNGRFGIEFNYSLGGNGNTIRKWIGTLKGSDGTGLNWKEVAYLNDHAMKSYSSLTDLELDTTATINDIVGKMANTSMFVYKTDVFDLSQYENLQFATVTIIKQSANRVQAIMTDKETGNLYIGYMNSSNKFVGWTKLVANEIIHTDLSGNLAGITTVLDLVNALLTEYRATSPKKPIRFVSGEFTKTTLTDLPVTYGLLQITVAGWDVIEVRLAHSANGFKSMYYGFVNRISGQESISSITWKEVTTKSIYNSVAELNKAKGTSIELVNGEDNTKKIVDTLSVGEQFISFYHNNANQNRFGIDVSYGNLIHELRITKCLDADLTANYATVTAFMNTGCVMSRIYYKTYSTDWSSTKDYVESLT